jgi:hypothetical protein
LIYHWLLLPIKIFDDFLFIVIFLLFYIFYRFHVTVAFAQIHQIGEQLLQTRKTNPFPCPWDFQGSPPISSIGLVSPPQAEDVRAFMNRFHSLICLAHFFSVMSVYPRDVNETSGHRQEHGHYLLAVAGSSDCSASRSNAV